MMSFPVRNKRIDPWKPYYSDMGGVMCGMNELSARNIQHAMGISQCIFKEERRELVHMQIQLHGGHFRKLLLQTA